ncbi:hypothetical protein BKA70DRAFT_775978 [Coprinopsis sp. MPI-PUGE-AT-0042]|nr:hypothetical protein BKA70DRAFT_775978 [Coprinopsis sp. MPI-PUGE-AT-0042]
MGSVADLVSLLASIRSGLSWQAAGSTMVLYDHVTTFDQEVELIWSQKWSSVQLLYFLNRYIGDALFLHGSTRIWATGEALEIVGPSGFQIQAWLSIVSMFALNGITVKRIMCMYGNDRRVVWTLLVAFFCFAVYACILTGLVANIPSVITRVPFTTYPFGACHPSASTPRWFWSFQFASVAFESLIFGLALYQGIIYVREKRRPNHYPRSDSALGRVLWRWQDDFVGVLLRDSILFPFLNLVLGVLTLLAWAEVLPLGSYQIFVVLTAAACPTLGCRLLLNLREAYYRPFRVEFHQTQTPDTSASSRSPRREDDWWSSSSGSRI